MKNKETVASEVVKTPSSDAALSGRELDIAVGQRVMGYQQVPSLGNWAWKRKPDDLPHSMPHYSRSIINAMEVVEKMALAGYEFDCGHTKSGGAGLFATARFGLTRNFENIPWQSEEWGEGKGWKRSYSETQALAICRAALAAVAST